MKLKVLILSIFVSNVAMAQVTEGKPKLVVGIMIDQMRNDFLFRYENVYGADGFKRLMKEGFYCANHHFSYAPTYTGPGHASVYTGTTPAVHGIASNNWYDPRTKSDMYCVEDKSVRTIGIANADGQMSPRNLLTTTITDELQLFWNFRSKIVGVALKDRGAILPAGHLGTAYWYSKGKFITSSFYMEELPGWVKDFNERKLPQMYLDKGWQLSLPLQSYAASLPDDSPYEKILADEGKSLMPKDLAKLAVGNGGVDLVKNTPFGNTLTLEFAKEAVRQEEMGKDGITDFLSISLSSPDYIGHAYGPRAVETQDMYLKLDAEIAELLSFLDKEVGAGEYLVFLTADHGAAEVGPFSTDHKLPGGLLNDDGLYARFDSIISQIHPEGTNLVEKLDDNKLYFNRAKVAEAGLNLQELCETMAVAMTDFEGIYAAYPSRDVMMGAGNDFPLLQLKRGLYPGLSGDIVWILDSGYISYGKTGTTHGSPWRYDTHNPLIFFGKGIKPGKTFKETNIRDIAPTLSMMLNIPLPSGSTGNPIEAILE